MTAIFYQGIRMALSLVQMQVVCLAHNGSTQVWRWRRRTCSTCLSSASDEACQSPGKLLRGDQELISPWRLPAWQQECHTARSRIRSQARASLLRARASPLASYTAIPTAYSRAAYLGRPSQGAFRLTSKLKGMLWQPLCKSTGTSDDLSINCRACLGQVRLTSNPMGLI